MIQAFRTLHVIRLCLLDMSMKGAPWTRDIDVGRPGPPFDPWQTAWPVAGPSEHALVIAPVGEIPEDVALAYARRTAVRSWQNPMMTWSVPATPLMWWGEISGHVVGTECVSISGALHEITTRVQIRVLRETYQERGAQGSSQASAQDLHLMLDYLRGIFLSLPDLLGNFACVAPDGVATVEITPELVEWHGIMWHEGRLTFDVIEREMLTLTWT